MISYPKLGMGFFVLLSYFKLSLTQDAWKRVCAQGYELAFFTGNFTYAQARNRCKAYKGHLVKVDSATMSREINRIIPSANHGFFIGGSDLKKEGSWLWEDGTKVPTRNETGYQNWKRNRPSQGRQALGKNCIKIAVVDLLWYDSDCRTPHNFICQRRAELKMSAQRSKGLRRFYCKGPDVNCVPNAKASWYRNGSDVSQSSADRIHQKKWDDGGATLFFENATLSESGIYVCHVKNKRHSVTVLAPSTPTIIGVKNFSCNSSLVISWRQHRNDVGSRHQITALGYAEIPRIFYVTPSSRDIQRTEIRLLDENSLINITVRSCGDKCSIGKDANTVAMTGRTRRVLSTVKLVHFHSQPRCNVTWSWNERDFKLSPGDFEVTVQSFIINSRDTRETNSQIHRTQISDDASFSFTAEPNRRYDVRVRPDNCNGFGESKKASGYCVGAVQAPAKLKSPEISTTENNVFVTVEAPDESAGLISCVFAIVSTDEEEGGNSTNMSLEELGNINSSGSICGGYIAIAIKISSYTGQELRLGDLSYSSCDIFDTGMQPNSSERRVFEGHNRQLISGKPYRVYIVSTTPSGLIVHIRKSAATRFNYGSQTVVPYSQEPGIASYALSFAIGVCTATFVGLVILLIRRCVRKKHQKNSDLEEERDRDEDTNKHYEVIREQDAVYMNDYGNGVDSRDNVIPAQPSTGTSGYLNPISQQKSKELMLETAYETFNA